MEERNPDPAPERDDEPDHTDDPRGRDTGDQLPEDAPQEHTGSEGMAGDPAGEPAHGGEGARGGSPDSEDDPSGASGEGSQSTGNPDAAG